jgi:FAD/FMN-containing dehydrogenase
LRSELGRHQVLLPDDGLERYERSVLGDATGRAAFVARPTSTAEVRAVVRWAYRHRVRLVPQSANSGLVHGGIPDGSGTMGVLSLELCKERLEVDRLGRTLTASAGYDLDWLNDHLRGDGLMLPVDVGSSPGVGGMVATNTGGTKVIGYGDVRRLTLGLEVVLADEDATVIDMLGGLRKNNTGLDLKQLFVATGGTYGVVTAATFELVPRPKQVATAWVVVKDDDAAFGLLQLLEADAGEFLTSFESMSGAVLELRRRHNPDLRLPFPAGSLPDLAILVELSSATPPDLGGLSMEELLVGVLDRGAARGHVVDAFLGRPEEMWALRHGIDEPAKEGVAFWVDVSLPRANIAVFRTRLFALAGTRHRDWTVLDLGHYGDGGLHVGLLYPFSRGRPPDPEEAEAFRLGVYELVAEHGGTFSAEHGIGPYNERYYRRFKDPAVQRLSGELKQLFDPRGILGVVNLGP